MGKYSTAAYHSFSDEIDKDWQEFSGQANRTIERVMIGGWKVAVGATPQPPSFPNASYQRTGRLAAGWKLNTGRTVGLVPAMGKYPKPTAPAFSFNIEKDKEVQLWNNVPYAKHVEDGAGPGSRTPRPMLKLATEYIQSRLVSELNNIKIR